VIHYERKSEIPKFHCSTRQFTTSENRKSPNSTAQRGSLLRAKIGNSQIPLLNAAVYYERKSEIPKFHCSTRQLTTSENRKFPNSTAQRGSLLRAKIGNSQIPLLDAAVYYERKSEIPKFHCSTRQLTTSENRKFPKSTAQCVSLLRAKIRNFQIPLLNAAVYYERKSEIPKCHCSTRQLTTSENQKSQNSTAQRVSLLRAKFV